MPRQLGIVPSQVFEVQNMTPASTAVDQAAISEDTDDFLLAGHSLDPQGVGSSSLPLMGLWNIAAGLSMVPRFGWAYFLPLISVGICLFIAHRALVRNAAPWRPLSLLAQGDIPQSKTTRILMKLRQGLFMFVFLTMNMYLATKLFSAWFSVSPILILIGLGTVSGSVVIFGGFGLVVKTQTWQLLPAAALSIILIVILASDFQPTAPNIALVEWQFAFVTFCMCILQFLTLIQQGELWNRLFGARSDTSRGKGLVMAFCLVVLFAVAVFLSGMALSKLNADVEIALTMLGNGMSDQLFAGFAALIFILYFNASSSTIFSLAALACPHDAKPQNKVRIIRIMVIVFTFLAAIKSLSVPSLFNALLNIIALGAVPGLAFVMMAFTKPSEKTLQAMLFVGLCAFLGFIYCVSHALILNNPMTSLIPTAAAFLAWIIWRR